MHAYTFIGLQKIIIESPDPPPWDVPGVRIVKSTIVVTPNNYNVVDKTTHPPTCVMQHVFVRQGTCMHILFVAGVLGGRFVKQMETVREAKLPEPSPSTTLPNTPLSIHIHMFTWFS